MSDRILTTQLKHERETFLIIGISAPEEGKLTEAGEL